MRGESTSLETAPSLESPCVEASQSIASVTTWRDFVAPPEFVWEALLFYEEIKESPPFVLRRLLPRPIGTDGYKFEVGGEVKCRYVGGHLLKRVTQITRPWNYSFDVIEQDLALGGIMVLGGEYTLCELPAGDTRVALTTRYASPNQPRWLRRWIEARICHSFHRYILTAMRSNVSTSLIARGN